MDYCTPDQAELKLGESDTVIEELRMYDAGISFNAVKYHIFNAFYEAVGQYGPGVKPLTYLEVKVPILKNEVDFTHKTLKVHIDE
ncbi:hypothetical protein Ddye_024590 [Dipteronia dyeriana]|uniref:Uncharacterized protein n=1 Tax=Dipteronia dyeriana TaxID=168575 RepID=A0AAD9WUD8_9ROSI|nr:hypothetical protein Ddye_024590 [Dipteronia dyeriana]